MSSEKKTRHKRKREKTLYELYLALEEDERERALQDGCFLLEKAIFKHGLDHLRDVISSASPERYSEELLERLEDFSIDTSDKRLVFDDPDHFFEAFSYAMDNDMIE